MVQQKQESIPLVVARCRHRRWLLLFLALAVGTSFRHEARPLSDFKSERTAYIENVTETRPFNRSTTTGWLEEYIQWHNEQRQQYPDDELIHHPEAPNVLLVYYPMGSEGLAGRFLWLGNILYKCYELQLLLLVTFSVPHPLENFMIPSRINWTVPLTNTTRTTQALTDHYPLFQPKQVLKRRHASDKRIVLAKAITGTHIYTKHEKRPHQVSAFSFHDYWHTMFQPSPRLEQALQQTRKELALSSTYDAIHCRVRHPAHEGKTSNIEADMHQGVVVADPDKWKLALETAHRSLSCSQWLRNDTGLPTAPIYFFADSEPLVRAIVINSNDTTPNGDMEQLESTRELARRFSAVGRFGHSVAHLEEKKQQPVDAYLSAFVDLYMAIQARCITLGVGRFAYLAARISGTKCLLVHEGIPQEIYGRWGMHQVQKKLRICPEDL